MRKFTSNLQTINESVGSKIETVEDFISFGKEICHRIMRENYNDEVVENYLTELCNSSADLIEALEKFDKYTMSKKELVQYAKNSLNTILEEFKAHPDEATIPKRLMQLSSKYGVFINESILANFAVLLEKLDVTSEFTANINEGYVRKLVLARYEPTTLSEARTALNTTLGFVDEFIEKYSRHDAPEILKQQTNTLGIGGLDIDFVKVVDNQIKQANRLKINLENSAKETQNIQEKDEELRKTTLTWFRGFMNDEKERYEYVASRLVNVGIDIDWFIKWGMDQCIGLIWQNKDFLLKNFYNSKFEYIRKAYRNYLTYTGITEDVFEQAGLNTDDLLNFYRIDSFAKMYELLEMIHELANYQEVYKTKLVNVFTGIVKPMIDSLRLDKEILTQRTLIRYQ